MAGHEGSYCSGIAEGSLSGVCSSDGAAADMTNRRASEQTADLVDKGKGYEKKQRIVRGCEKSERDNQRQSSAAGWKRGLVGAMVFGPAVLVPTPAQFSSPA